MCVTLLDANLSETIIGLWDIDHPTLGYRRVMAYQNVPRNESDEANCMLLHVPTAAPITPECLLNTEKDPDLLSNMAARVLPASRGAFGTRGAANFAFEMGIYHIVVLNDPKGGNVQSLLAAIPEAKRPDVTEEVLQFYAEEYPDFALVVCCFNNRESKKASPIMLHYDPAHPELYFYPTLESHGSLPTIGEEVKYHQKIILGHSSDTMGEVQFKAIDHSECSEHLQAFLPAFGTGMVISGELPNSDVVVPKNELPTFPSLYGRLYHEHLME